MNLQNFEMSRLRQLSETDVRMKAMYDDLLAIEARREELITEIRKHLGATPISQLGLSARAFNRLVRNGVTSIEALQSLLETEGGADRILNFYQTGEATLREIVTAADKWRKEHNITA